MTRLIITATHCSRPDYTAQHLKALAACEGIEDCLYLPHVEPGYDTVRALIERFDLCETRPFWNRQRLGVNANTRAALDRGVVQGTDSVLHVEDDILLAPDALAYFAWALERYREDPTVGSIAGYNRVTEPPAPAERRTVARRRYFHPWAWATWRDRWRALRAEVGYGRLTWDCDTLHFAERNQLDEVYPVLSRAQNIGRVSSIYGPKAPKPEWYDEHHRVKIWAGQWAFRTIEGAWTEEQTHAAVHPSA